MSAKASGADRGANGTAKSREHNQGNQDREYTPVQEAAVLRVRRCSPTAFYDILELEAVRSTVTETEIKKAYRKVSLLTHPDKNGHPHADEAFKMVSRAFGVLGDAEKRAKFDRYGGDPDSRFGGGAAAPQSPFAGFGGRTARSSGGGAGGRGMWEEEISPEEMFNRFFGGGFGGGGFGGGGMFDTGPQFVFNMGGGPGIRVHQFGGARPRRRPRDPNAPPEPPPSLQATLLGLLPLLLVIALPLLSSIFSGSGSGAAGPSMRFDSATPPHTMHRHTPKMNVDYYINPAEVESFSASQFHRLDQKAESHFIQDLGFKCDMEKRQQQRLYEDAQGWFFPDMEKMQRAQKMELQSCNKLREMHGLRNK